MSNFSMDGSRAYWSPTGSMDPADMESIGEGLEVEFVMSEPNPVIDPNSLRISAEESTVTFYVDREPRIPETIPGYVVIRTEDGRIIQYRKLPNGDVELIALPGNYSFAQLDDIAQAVHEHMEPNATMTRHHTIRDFVEAAESAGIELPEDIEDEDDDSPVQTTWVLDDGTETTYGPIERRLRAELGTLKIGGHLAGTMVETAYNLAAKLDRDAGMATAAVARELRAFITEIERLAGDDNDTRDHRTDLSTPV